MYECESWTIKKAECWRTDAFELWCWRRLVRVPWTAKRSNQSRKSVLNIHWRNWCWSWNSNNFAMWCKELTHWERLKAGAKGDLVDEMIGWHHQLSWHVLEYAPGVGNGQGSLACCCSWGHKESDTTERLNWTELSYQFRDKYMTQLWSMRCIISSLQEIFWKRICILFPVGLLSW